MKRDGPWMPFFGDAFFESEAVLGMSPGAAQLYLYLLWHEWKNGPFTSEVKVLRRLCARFPAFDELWAEVSEQFQLDEHGRLSNPRCEAERAVDLELSKKRSSASLRRWQKVEEYKAGSKCNAIAMHEQCQDKTGQDRTRHTSPSVTKARTAPPPVVKIDLIDVIREFPSLDTIQIHEATRSYLAGRAERKQKAQTARGLRMALKGLASLEPAEALDVIEQATAGGWLGWPADSARKNGHAQPRAYGFETAFEANMKDLAKLAEKQSPGEGPWQAEMRSSRSLPA